VSYIRSGQTIPLGKTDSDQDRRCPFGDRELIDNTSSQMADIFESKLATDEWYKSATAPFMISSVAVIPQEIIDLIIEQGYYLPSWEEAIMRGLERAAMCERGAGKGEG